MKIDPTSLTWRAVNAYLQERLSACREKNDKALDALATATLRGEISALKDLLALPFQVTQVERDDPGYGTDSLD
jgi:hypothetical protein